MRRALFFVLFVLVAAPAVAQPQPLAGFDAWVSKGIKDWRTPGLAVAVVKDGQVVFAQGFGVRELGKPTPVDTRTLFAIGSTTKAMTAALVGMLVDEKKVEWDAPVTRYLPVVPAEGRGGDARAERARSAHAPRRARQRRLSVVRAAPFDRRDPAPRRA